MSYRLPEKIVDSLLEKLGNDDVFREAFLADSRAALASLGFAPAADATIRCGLWECLFVDELASKEVIRRSHTDLRRQLFSESVFFPFTIGIRHSSEKQAA